ncbi:hypothetical protein [Prevotella heparinolytica]|uniref:hypothetical protein n=1 Tax=Prevotella heparinolytica TaxID=28113 RepID=UPI0010476D6E|nr:hypothetical protein [Bacteroides heparinolyticus]
MKKIRLILNVVAGFGLLATVSLADSLYPTTKELVSSAVIFGMSVAMLLTSHFLKEYSPK